MSSKFAAIKTVEWPEVFEHYKIRLSPATIKGEEKLTGSCPLHEHFNDTAKNSNQFQACLESPNPDVVGTWICFGCKGRGTILDFIVLKSQLQPLPSPEEWLEIAANREKKNKVNWVSTENLKLASQLMETWFIKGKPEKPPPKIAQDARKEVETVSGTAEPEKRTRNLTWLEQWGKPEATYSKFYVENEYLNSRGIRPDLLKEFEIGFYSNPKSKSVVNNRILFPIHNKDGELLAFAARTTEDEGARYWFPPIEKFDRMLELWNYHRAIESDEVYVLEGFFGVLNLVQHGYNALATMGSNLSDAQAEMLTSFRVVTLIVDPDSAGLGLAEQFIKKLHGRVLLKLIFPSVQVDSMSAEELKTLLG